MSTCRTIPPLHATCRTLLAMAALCVVGTLRGQDIHFSQIDFNPVLYNPAYNGFFDGDGRFGAVYRNQWAAVTKPFQTFAATAEVPIVHGRAGTSGLSGGAIFAADRAGSLSYGSTSLQAIASYYFSLTGRGDALLSMAVQGGYCQSGFDETNIQFSEGAESFDRTRVSYPTIGLGVALFKQFSTDFNIKVGVAALNLNQPSNSYLETQQTVVQRRFNFYARGEYEAWNRVSVMPLIGYQRQGRYNELIYGADVRWYINDSPRNFLALSGGIVVRHADAAMLTFAVERGSLALAFAYDANTSRLAKASHTIGSFEVGIVYRIIKPHARYRPLPCPII